MEGNEKQEENLNLNKKSVTNPWCVVESKSRPGYKYYYNVETKESIWLPCDAQVDKAKCNKNPTYNQPEAIGNQPKNITNESDGSSKMYNNHVKNNKFLNQNFNTAIDENEKNINNPINFVNTAPINIPTIPIYNPDVWSVPPTAQFVLTTSIPPVINQPQILQPQVLLPVSLDSLPQNILTQAIREFRNGSTSIMQEKSQGFKRKHYNVNCGDNRSYSMHRNFNTKRKIDLTEKQSSKDYIYHNSDMYTNNYEGVSHLKEVCNGTTRYHNDQGIHKYLETSHRLDLTVIRDLATSNVNMEQWFIVADRNVIQENFIFLNTLMDSDNSCRIMVPQCVLEDLHTLAIESNSVNIRRIFRFISTEVKVGNRWMGDNFINAEPNCSPFDVCQKLSSENYHVVLVSNDKECLKYKNITQIPVFTIQDFKNMLTNSQSLHKPIKTKFFEDRLVSVVHGEQINNSENSSNILSFNNQHSCALKPRIIDKQETIVKENSIEESNTTLSIGKNFTKVEPTLCVQENGMSVTISNTDEPSSKNIDTPSTVSYNKRVIKLKHSSSNQKPINNSKRGWSNRKRANNGKNVNLLSADKTIDSVSTSSKQSIIEQQTNDVSSEVMGCKYNKNSVDLLYNTLEYTNDQSSESCVPLKKNKTDIVNDESSKLIEKAESAFDSESIVKDEQISTLDSDEANIKVMFKIPDKNIDEYFTIRCDEWISRYVQIMEEVLSQVLNQEPTFTCEEFPPPWTLKEAAQCVIKKFFNCVYIVDAANNLSIVIHKASDTSGKITVKNPSEFMKMYSYGMYLVKALLNVCNSCEDLNNAVESLKKLLDDIQNHDIDCLNNSFNNSSQEPPVVDKDSRPSNDVEETRSTIEEPVQKIAEKCTAGRTLSESEPDLFEKNDEEIEETSFFSSLELKKSYCSTANNPVEELGQTIIVATHDVDKNESQVTTCQPKFIRRFNKCIEFENRLKIKNLQSMQCEQLDHDSDDVHSEDSYSDENLGKEGNEEFESENSIDTLQDNMKKFKCFIGLFVTEISKVFSQVHALCKNLIASEYKQLDSDKADVHKKVEMAHDYIDKLSKSLESILIREADDPDNNLQNLMKKSGIHITFDQRLINEYRSIISKCMKQTQEYLSYINLVLTINKESIV